MERINLPKEQMTPALNRYFIADLGYFMQIKGSIKK
jgi:hypothetical protein